MVLWQMQKFMCYCAVFTFLNFEFWTISKYKPPGACIWRGDLSESFLCYEFGGLIFKGGYFWNFKGIWIRVERAL